MLIFLIYVGSITSGGWEGRTEGPCDPLPVTRSPTCLCFPPCLPSPPPPLYCYDSRLQVDKDMYVSSFYVDFL